MNIQHLRYAVEIARCGSINKAAENLLMNQPNLSRAIKELETSLGVEIFTRSTKGMIMTPNGEKFIGYAEKILKQVDEVEDLFKNNIKNRKTFSICAPRASYISEAFANSALKFLKNESVETVYNETNATSTIQNIVDSNYNLGIIRYGEEYDKYYKDILRDKGLSHELIMEFNFLLTVSKNSPLAYCEKISYSDLEKSIEIAYGDLFIPSLPYKKLKEDKSFRINERNIRVFERQTQFEIVSRNSEAYLWSAPLPKGILERFDLVQRNCDINTKIYKDLMIKKEDYKLTELDNIFISEVYKSKRNLVHFLNF